VSALAVADGCLAGFDAVKVGALERVWRALEGSRNRDIGVVD